MSARRTVVRALVLVPLALLALELLLRATDLGAGGSGRCVGLDEGAAYLLPVEGTPGAYRTTMFADEMPHHDLVIPPRDGRRRVLLMGGSSTQGFPEDVLAERLAAAAPGPGWEVVNLGRAGYGSERVRILFAQAVARLQPDVAVLYVGHNEFMEPGFATATCERGLPPWVLRAGNAVLRSRIAGLVAPLGGWEDRARRAPERPPEPRRGRDERHARMTPACTAIVWDAYRDNLARMLAAARAHGCAVVLCTVAGNPLTAPYASTLPPDEPPLVGARVAMWLGEARARLPRRLVDGLVPRAHPHLAAWGQNLTPAEEAARREASRARGPDVAPPPLRALSGPFADPPASIADKAASAAGALWTDPRLWTEEVVAFVEGLRAFFARELTPPEREALVAAAALHEQVLALVPDHPRALFELGIARHLLGEDDAAARALLERAAAADRAPRHGNARSNALVRALAAASDPDEVVLLDVEALLASRCPDGLLAFDVLLDECHLQPGARVVLMQDLVAPILRASGVTR